MIKDMSNRDNLFFVGDIHGQFDALMFGYIQLGITGADMIISVGDVVDRGNKSVECLQFFLDASNAIMVRGNHEDMFVKGFVDDDSYMYNMQLFNGGGWVLDYPETYMKSLAFKTAQAPMSLTITHGDKKFGVCHAECPTDKWVDVEHPPTASIEEDCLWGRNKITDPKFEGQVIEGVDYTIHGHTPRKDVTVVGNQLFIDTGGQAISDTCGLTFLQWDGEKFTKYLVTYDHLEGGYVLSAGEVL